MKNIFKSLTLPKLLNALASVLMIMATFFMRGSSKAALVRMGWGKEVAKLKFPLLAKETPGLAATPCYPQFSEYNELHIV
jgi:hypothetical protein